MLNRLRHLPAYLYIVATTAAMGLLYAAQSGSPPQSAPANPAQAGAAPTPAVAQAAGNLSMEERIRRLEEQVNLALALKDERIQSLIERSESIYKQLQYVAGFAALALLFFSIRDGMPTPRLCRSTRLPRRDEGVSASAVVADAA